MPDSGRLGCRRRGRRRRYLSIMRSWCLLLLGLLLGCGRSHNLAIDDEYLRAERLLNQGELKQALIRADTGLKKCGSSPERCWKFRLLKAQSALLSGQERMALSLLDIPDVPPKPELEVVRRMH